MNIWISINLLVLLKIVDGALEPCAWLESGGVFARKTIFKQATYFVRSLIECRLPATCNYAWSSQDDPKSISLKLMGTDDMRSYIFQTHFCKNIYRAYHVACKQERDEVAYKFVLQGNLMLLDAVECICPGTADVLRYTYIRGIFPYEAEFPIKSIFFNCQKMPQCQDSKSYCYSEVARGDGKIYEGEVICECPSGYFCPLYFLRNKRKLVDGYYRRYMVKCQKRYY